MVASAEGSDLLDYIGQLSAELGKMAAAAQYSTLAVLLAMAKMEAHALAGRASKPQTTAPRVVQ